MADDLETQYICMKKRFAEAGVETKCVCPTCTGRGKKYPLKRDVEFPELIENACRKELEANEYG